MKIFFRSFNPYINSKSGDPLPNGVLRGCTQEWKKFEAVLKDCLVDLDHEIVEQLENPKIPDKSQDASLKIYAHKTQRDIPEGDFFYMQVHLSHLFSFDSHGWGADHSRMQQKPNFTNVDLNLARDFTLSLKQEFLSTGESKHPQPKSKAIKQVLRTKLQKLLSQYPKDYILIPLQIPRDYVAKHHAPITVLEFVHAIADWADKVRQPVVFKLHPYNIQDFDIINAVKHYTVSSNYVFCLSGNIHNLINESRGVYTINSGVGFESLIHGKPVVTFGNCDYKWVTFRANTDKLDEARDYVYESCTKLQNLACQFIYFYCSQHAFSIKNKDIEQTKHRLKNYLSDTTSSITQLS